MRITKIEYLPESEDLTVFEDGVPSSVREFSQESPSRLALEVLELAMKTTIRILEHRANV